MSVVPVGITQISKIEGQSSVSAPPPLCIIVLAQTWAEKRKIIRTIVDALEHKLLHVSLRYISSGEAE